MFETLSGFSGRERDPNKNGNENLENERIIKEKAAYIYGLAHPESGDNIRKIINEQLYKGENNYNNRTQVVRHNGYPIETAENLGENMINIVNKIEKTIPREKTWVPQNEDEDASRVATSTYPLVYSGDSEKTRIRHSKLTVGLSKIISGQIEEVLKVSLGNGFSLTEDPKKPGVATLNFTSSNGQEETTAENIRKFIADFNDPNTKKIIKERQANLLSKQDEENQNRYKQYYFIIRTLNELADIR